MRITPVTGWLASTLCEWYVRGLRQISHAWNKVNSCIEKGSIQMWETSKGRDCPSPGGAITQKEKAGTMVPSFSFCRSLAFEKDLPPLFLLRCLFHFLLGGLLLRLGFFCFFLRRGFLLRRFLGWLLRPWLGRRLCRRRLFLGLLADDHQLLFLGLDDLFRFARQLLVVFQPRQLVVVFEIVLLEIHSILPWENPRAPHKRVLWVA